MLPTSGAVAEIPSLASRTAMRVFSASFSSRARRAMSLTASNSSRLTTSRSRRNFSAWLRITVSNSRFMPCAAPAASFIRRPISSKNRLLVWVMAKLRLRRNLCNNGDPCDTIQVPRIIGKPARLVMRRFPCNRIACPKRKPQSSNEKNRHDRPANRNCDQGRPHHDLHHPSRAWRTLSRHHLPYGCAGDPRGTARHGAPVRHVGLLRDAAKLLLPRWRDGARTAARRFGIARTQAHVPTDELDRHPDGDGGYQGPPRLCRGPARRQHAHHRHRRLLHERTLRDQRGD